MKSLAILFFCSTAATTAIAEGDAEQGARVFKKCAACHSTEEGKAKLGPSLFGIVGRESGTVEGFKYSNGMKEIGVVWDDEQLSAFLENPKGYVDGTRMSFAGLRKEEQRADVIAYLKTLQ